MSYWIELEYGISSIIKNFNLYCNSDSNRDAFMHNILSVACLPFPPLQYILSQRQDSNLRHSDYKSDVLPTELLWLL